LFYGDGAKYVGEFMRNKRHGRGIFQDKDGSESYGSYIDDERDGEHIVKVIVPIEGTGQSNFKIRIGIYDNGQFIRWKSKLSNESATNTFIRLFK
jgi:type IV secretory pathway VirB9-like protein